MITTHQLAKKLLEGSDIPLEIEGWVRLDGWSTEVVPAEYNDGATAIIVQRPPPSDGVDSRLDPFSGEIVWRNIAQNP